MIASKALTIAISQLGICEHPKGSNWGDDVKKFLASVGINFPASWCMAFVYWCFNEAAKQLSITNPLFKTGGVINQYNNRKAFIVKTPQPGDVFIMDLGKGLGHTGIVKAVKGDVIETVEGNTNDAGEREGYEVAIRFRKVSSIKAFLRFK